MQEALNQKIDAFVAANKEQILKDIATLVSINSVEGTPEEGAPYGAGPRAALDKTLELAAGMGLATRNCENYIGYAELAGKDPEKYLATICHVDVVPVGNGWTAPSIRFRPAIKSLQPLRRSGSPPVILNLRMPSCSAARQIRKSSS